MHVSEKTKIFLGSCNRLLPVDNVINMNNEYNMFSIFDVCCYYCVCIAELMQFFFFELIQNLGFV